MNKAKRPAKRMLAVLLAVLLALSTLPLALAAGETGPVSQATGSYVGGVDDGHYVSFMVNNQNFTFIQTKDDEAFRFEFTLSAKKNHGVNYGWIYERSDTIPQTFATTLGKSTSVAWSTYIGGLPGTLFGGNNWSAATITVDFVGNGAAIYDTTFNVTYDGRDTSSGSQTWYVVPIPMIITVLDKRALNTAITQAQSAAADAAYYTDASWAEVEAALTDALTVAGDIIATQTVINRYTIALQGALNNLEYKAADYTALETAKAAAKQILDTADVDDLYTPTTLAALREKYEAALGIPLTGLDIRNQGDIDTAALALEAALAAATKFADYSVVVLAIGAFENLNPNYYSAQDIADIAALVQTAKDEMSDVSTRRDETQQDEVDAMADGILDAIAALEMLDADYTALNAARALALEKLTAQDIANYTSDSVAALDSAYTAALAISGKLKKDNQAVIDAAALSLEQAIAGLTLRAADYAALDAAIASAQAQLSRSDIADFTDTSVAQLESVLASANSVSRDLTIDKQQVVNDAASALNAAVRGLTLKGADYAALDAAIAAREAEISAAKLAGIYTAASITRVEIAIAAAKDVDRTYSIKEQHNVDDAVVALNSVALEIKAADYTQLRAAIAAAKETLNNADDSYTDASKAALAQAIKDAEAVVAAKYDITNQTLVDAALTALNAVALEKKDADYTALNAAITAAKAFLDDPQSAELYTQDALKKVEDALTAAQAIESGLDIDSQGAIDTATSGLVNAVEQARGDYKPADLSALEEAIAAAKAKLAASDIEDYTTASRTALQGAIDDAEDYVATAPNITQQDLVTAKANALNAMSLTLKGADYTALDEAAAQALIDYNAALASGLYTAESLAAFKAVIDDANELLESRSLTIKQQSVVDAAVQALKVDLEYKKADLTALNAAIDKAQATIGSADYSNYTAASRAAIEAALAAAIALRDAQPDITRQSEVNAAADSLNAVNLVLDSADYSALDEIIEAAQAKLNERDLTDKYTLSSIANLRAALADALDIDRNLDLSSQAIVDDAADALSAALNALAPYNKVTGVEITGGGSVIDGDVYYVQVPWYVRYNTQSAQLGLSLNTDADIKSVTWEYYSWSIDNPEAVISPSADGMSATITPTGGLLGAQSCWVKVTVEDVNGNISTDIVKVRFYHWSWQAR